MNMKKKIKEFFAMSRQHDGFTLVELIVVIAILAILAGVAVPAYNGYITKTNMAADHKLASEVKQALALAFYSNPEEFNTPYIVLSMDKAPEGENVEAIMSAVYGSAWSELRLKHDGWAGGIAGSSIAGTSEKVGSLLNTVDGLTSSLGNVLEAVPGLAGANFESYYKTELGEGANSASIADVAVFYVADKSANWTDDQILELSQKMVGRDPDAVLNALQPITGSTLSSAALMYSVATGYAEYSNNDEVKAILAGVTEDFANADPETINPTKVYGDLMNAFTAMSAVDSTLINKYLAEEMLKDMTAYRDSMKMINDNKSTILNNTELGSNDTFSRPGVQNIFVSFANGSVVVSANVADGVITVGSSTDTYFE